MARKKDIENFINGIVGKDEPAAQLPAADAQGNLPKETAEALQITPEMEEQLNAARRANVGRPAKGTTAKGREHRATFIVDVETIKKLKYISLVSGKLLKTITTDALTNYVKQWENENGTINLPK